MNTDEENTGEFKIKMPVFSGNRFHRPGRPSAITAFTILVSLSLSVFIRVNPWFQRIYPTDASW
jgi:hypothetical protein